MAQDPFKYFRVEAHELVDQLGKGVLELERDGQGVAKMLRLAHTLKGAARVVRRPDIADHAHAIEDILAPHRESQSSLPIDDIRALLDRIEGIVGALETLSQPQPAAPSPGAGGTAKPVEQRAEEFRTVFTEVSELDGLLEGVAETRAQLAAFRQATTTLRRTRTLAEQLNDRLATRRERHLGLMTPVDPTSSLAEELSALIAGLDRGLANAQERMERELQQVHDAAEQLRLVPAGAIFAFLDRAVRDAGETLGKLVAFEGKGGNVRLDAHLLRVMHEVLLHMVRNAVAHGIEADRVRPGKPPIGRVTVEILRRGRRIIFRCQDDGRGIDLEAVRRAAVGKGMARAKAEAMTSGELIDLLLAGGISTSATVNAVSGRGVGMDIVKSAIARLGGTMSATSEPGRGTAFELSMPLTLAAAEALIIESNEIAVGIPVTAIRHVGHVGSGDTYRTARGEEMIYEGQPIPFAPLERLLDRPAAADIRAAVVIAGGGGLAAIGVGTLRGIANLVFRSLSDLTPASAVVAGASLDADGNPQLVLDPDELTVEAARHRARPTAVAAAARPILVIDDSLTTRMLEQSILESAGYEVDLATSAEEALEIAETRDYALFLVDVEMPGMDGFDFVQHIRADSRLRDIPAVLVTSLNAPEHLERGRAVGAQDYVIKSEFNQARLLARIEELTAAP